MQVTLHHQPRFKGDGTADEGLVNNKAKNINHCVERISKGGQQCCLLQGFLYSRTACLQNLTEKDSICSQHSLPSTSSCHSMPAAGPILMVTPEPCSISILAFTCRLDQQMREPL